MSDPVHGRGGVTDADALAPRATEPGAAEPGDGDALELADLLNTALDKGVVAHGDVTIAVADIDLVRLNIGLLLSAIETAEQRAAARRPGPGRSLAAAMGPPVLERRAINGEPEPGIVGEATSGAVAGEAPGVAERASGELPDDGVALAEVVPTLPARIDAAAPGVESGLARLVLTLIEVLRKVLEHQAVRRMEGGRLREDEIERLGLALASLHDRMEDLKRVFGLSDADLEIDLGPLGRLR